MVIQINKLKYKYNTHKKGVVKQQTQQQQQQQNCNKTEPKNNYRTSRDIFLRDRIQCILHNINSEKGSGH